MGFDKSFTHVIKDGLSVILSPITDIINAFLASGIFPGGWKQGEVTPVPKEGDHKQPCNDRLILLLPVLSQVCKRIVLNQLTAYLPTNNYLSAKQSGNKKFHFTETTLICSTDAILTGMYKQDLSSMVLLDMSKAFDSVDHDILLLKLQDLGISKYALMWFTSYLTNRSQVMHINSTLSSSLHLKRGYHGHAHAHAHRDGLQNKCYGPKLNSLGHKRYQSVEFFPCIWSSVALIVLFVTYNHCVIC